MGGGGLLGKIANIGTMGATGALGLTGGGGGGGGGNKNAITSLDSFGSPDLFKPYYADMPAEYHGDQPIYDPSSILNAYMQHLPAFMNASKPVDITKLANTVNTNMPKRS